jgi:hypothetical protein
MEGGMEGSNWTAGDGAAQYAAESGDAVQLHQ